MRAGRAIREAAADRAWRCPDCGHAESHLELRPTVTCGIGADGKAWITETPHPDYRPGEFHCAHEGCGCVIRTDDDTRR